tara:strand:- start:72710 stop:73447 length:738 start_codon:yes stop_codon:yes gene_type:complete
LQILDLEKGKSRRKSVVKLAILIIIAFSGFMVYTITPLSNYTQPAKLEVVFGSIKDTWWAPLVFIFSYAFFTVVGVPMVVLTIFAGFTFGTAKGTLYVLIGANLGANLAFNLARFLGRDFIARYIKGPIGKIDRQLRDQGFLRVLQLRLLPVIPFNLLNLAAGLSGIRKIHYVFGTMIGVIPASFIYVYTASSFMQVYIAGSDMDELSRISMRSSALINLGIALTLLIVISTIPLIFGKLRRKNE